MRQRLVGYGFLLPTFVLIGVFAYYPAVKAAVTAFTRWDGFNPPEFIGVANFTQAFTDPIFWQAAWHVALWTLIGVPLAMIPSFIVAELIFRLHSERAQYLWRAVFVAPIVLPPVVSILIWQYAYGANGPINAILKSVGKDSWVHAWLAEPQFALWALIFLGFPWVSGFNVLIYYAGLKAIPTEVMEAAALDGASRWKQLLRLEVPLTAGQWKLLLVLSIIGVSQNLTLPLLLTNGGPANRTLTTGLYMYQRAIDYSQYGYGMAIGTLLFAVVLGLSILNMRLLRSRG
jgi:ABC-type sugar transport system permease subunit